MKLTPNQIRMDRDGEKLMDQFTVKEKAIFTLGLIYDKAHLALDETQDKNKRHPDIYLMRANQILTPYNFSSILNSDDVKRYIKYSGACD